MGKYPQFQIQTLTQKKISSSSSCAICFLKIKPTFFPQNQTNSPIFFNRLTPSPHSSNLNQQKPTTSSDHQLLIQSTRRRNLLNLSLLSIIMSSCKSSWANETEDLQSYTDFNQGFTLLLPSSWIKVEKAGATALFEDPSKGSNNVGVVVTPVRLKSLGEFGDPQFVSNKLIQAEKRKESTKDAEVISFVERPGRDGGVQVYEFEYKVDSTRGGPKRVFSAAFVSSKKLYLLNIAQSDTPQQPLDNHKRLMLEKVLHSFDVVDAALPPSTSKT